MSTRPPGEDAPHPTQYVHAGQIVVRSEPSVLSTVLGSCVAVCLWDPVAAVGGLDHYMLPDAHGPDTTPGRYGPFANELLLALLVERGASRARLLGKVFGGAHVVHALSARADSLGAKNVELAIAFLAKNRVPVVGSDVGGDRGRKLIFRTVDGAAWVRRL